MTTAVHIDPKAVAAHVVRHLAREQARGRLVRLDDLAKAIGIRRPDVRRVVASLHAEGYVDAQRMRLTMAGLALAVSLRGAKLRAPRVRKTAATVRAA